MCLAALISGLFSACYFISFTTEDGGILQWRQTEDGIAIRNYEDRLGVNNLVIPNEIDGKRVVEIANFGVVNSEQLHVITIGKYVERIGTFGLVNNSRLRRFEVHPENVHFTVCEDGALYTYDMKTLLFYPIGAIRSMKISDGGVRTDLGNELEAIRNDGSITEDERFFRILEIGAHIVIPEGVEVIRANAFYRNNFVVRYTLPSTVRKIGQSAFLLNSDLIAINATPITFGEDLLPASELPEGLESIGKDAFLGCERLRFVIIPSTVTFVDEFAFFNAWRLRGIEVRQTEAQTASWHHRWNLTQNRGRIAGGNVTFVG